MIERLRTLRRSAPDPEGKGSGTQPSLALNGRDVPIILRRHHRAKRLTLRLAPDGSEVRCTLPSWARASEAIAFARLRADWLAEQAARIPRRIRPHNGGTILYRGRDLTVRHEDKAPRRPRLCDNELVLGGDQAALETRIKSWLESEAIAVMEGDLREYCAKAGLAPVPLALSRAQRRWGSCSDKKRIRINWRLIQAPDFVRRSVVAHETAHLVHFDHSPAFHTLLGVIYEGEISKADLWLRQNGRSLYAQFG